MTTVAVTFRSSDPDEDLTSHVLVVDGIVIKRGKQQALGATEITTCTFSAKRSLLKTAAWRLGAARTTEDVQVTVNGSVRFTGWFWRSEEDIFDERGVVRVTLASTGLRSIIEDVRPLRYGTRALPGTSDAVAFVGVDAGLLALGQLVDAQRPFTASTGLAADDPSFQKSILDPPNNLPQLESGGRNVYAPDVKFRVTPGTTIAPPFTVSFTANMSVEGATLPGTVKLLGIYTETYSAHLYNSSSGSVTVLVRDEVVPSALVNTTVAYATRNSTKGELWHFNVNVIESGGNVQTVVTCRPMSRAEGPSGDLPGVVLVDNTSAAPAGGVGPILKIEWGPASPGLTAVADSIVADILVRDDAAAADGANEFRAALGGLGLTSLTSTWVPYYDLTSQLNSGTYSPFTPVIPPGTGAEQLAAIEEVHRTVMRDSRTADFTVIRTGVDYVPTQVTEVEVEDDYLRGLGSAGEEAAPEVLVPDANYLATGDPYGAQWTRNRSRRWARLPVNLDSATKRAVDVGASLVSFWTPAGNLFRGRVAGIEEQVTPALHTAFWVVEEWPSEAEVTTGAARTCPADGSALAATVNATYSGGSSLTVDATYSYATPFTVRPAGASRYFLVISGISGTTWTVNTGSSSLPPDGLAVGDLLNINTPGVAW